ncbi:MAG: hypothetical protein STSR0007_09110 [Thermovirga sp.]
MKTKPIFLLVGVVLLLSAVSGLIFWRYTGMIRENGLLREKLALASEELEKTRALIHTVQDGEPLPRPEWEKLRSSARPDPRSWLTESILSRQDLIPWKGIHGGTMRIYDPSMVWFVGPRWCIAWVEDGHIGGYILLRFDPENEKPQWHLLDSEIGD